MTQQDIDALKNTVPVGMKVTSAYRPGAITASGNISNHAKMKAIDVVGTASEMEAYARSMQSRYGSVALEIIHRSPHGDIYVHNGVAGKGSESLMKAHRDHVHFAATADVLGGPTAVTPVSNTLAGGAMSSVVGLGSGVSELLKINSMLGKLSDQNVQKRLLLGTGGIILVYVGMTGLLWKPQMAVVNTVAKFVPEARVVTSILPGGK